MSLRLFETDPDAAPKPRTFAADTVGRFRSGRMVGRRPESLDEWRVTTGDPAVADAVSQLLGGRAEEWETQGEDGLEILTNAKSVGIVIDGSNSIKADMRQYANSQLFHHCDGVEYLSPEEKRGNPCGCPRLFAERKELAKAGGPKPNIDIRFKLAEDVNLGYFRFVTGSWDMVKALGDLTDNLSDAQGPVRAELRIEPVSFTAKSGPRAGQVITYNRPVIEVAGPYRPDDPMDLGKPSSPAVEDDEPPY
ncbi:hypothetical protein [Streptomyces sp. SM12]|uniref:recombination directionality factor n=1 Tax=Streptomyces sp. SM12 TaxID=1071602 RepID=UPI0015E1B332|nr:hypothetical protein [Streptomyces sp. SM12]